MDFPMEKGVFIFQMAATSRGGLIKAKLQDKTTFLFTQMDPFIEDLSNNQKKMDSANYFFIMDFNIQVFG